MRKFAPHVPFILGLFAPPFGHPPHGMRGHNGRLTLRRGPDSYSNHTQFLRRPGLGGSWRRSGREAAPPVGPKKRRKKPPGVLSKGLSATERLLDTQEVSRFETEILSSRENLRRRGASSVDTAGHLRPDVVRGILRGSWFAAGRVATTCLRISAVHGLPVCSSGAGNDASIPRIAVVTRFLLTFGASSSWSLARAIPRQ